MARSKSRPKLRQRANPLGYAWDKATRDTLSEVNQSWRGHPDNALVYHPEAAQRLPPEGAWAMITRRLPPLEGGVDRHVRVARIFFLEREPSADAEGFLPDGTYRAVLRSPWGELRLWPYEYSVVPAETVVELWAAGELVFRPTAIDDARLNATVFYARSRGVDLAAAAVMALGTLNGNVGWFEPTPDLAAEAEAMEERVHRGSLSRSHV